MFPQATQHLCHRQHVACEQACTRQWADKSGVQIPEEANRFFFSSPKCPNHIWGLPSLQFNWRWGSFPGHKKKHGCKVDHSLHLVPRLRTNGTIPQALLYAFMVWTGTTSPFCYLPAVTAMLNPLHQVWWGQHPSIWKLYAYFIIDSTEKLLDTPSYLDLYSYNRAHCNDTAFHGIGAENQCFTYIQRKILLFLSNYCPTLPAQNR